MMHFLAWQLLGVAIVCATPLQSQGTRPNVDSAMFVVRIGADTARYMWIVRDGLRLTTVTANRIPTLRVLRGRTTLERDWSVRELEQLVTNPAAPDASALVGRTRISRSGDSTIVESGTGTSANQTKYLGGGQFINTSHYFETLALIGGVPAIGDSTVGQHFAGSLFPPQRFVVRRMSRDSATAWSRPLGVIRMKLGRRGEVLEFDGAGTSALNFTGVRAPWRDIDSTIAALRLAEQSGRTFGALSGRDSVRATASGAEIRIDYGRPSKRGRVIFGNIVPFDTVWRTGANRATHFTSSRNLDFGGRVLPAGTYTLWTLPARTGWTLIFNRQTGQWGTEYDPAHDVMRIPMVVSSVSVPVEQLTISIDPAAAGGELRVAWETTVARASFTSR